MAWSFADHRNMYHLLWPLEWTPHHWKHWWCACVWAFCLIEPNIGCFEENPFPFHPELPKASLISCESEREKSRPIVFLPSAPNYRRLWSWTPIAIFPSSHSVDANLTLWGLSEKHPPSPSPHREVGPLQPTLSPHPLYFRIHTHPAVLPALFTMVTGVSALNFPKLKIGKEPKEVNVLPMSQSFVMHCLVNSILTEYLEVTEYTF